MNKIKKMLAICFMAIIFASIQTVFSIKVQASDSVDISSLNTVITVQRDGSLNIKESIVYNFNGEFNGAYRSISVKDTDGIKNIVVSKSENNTEKQFKMVDKASNGDNNVFQVIKDSNDTYKIKIYSPSKNEEKEFNISYTLENVAIKHNDIGELYFNFWSKGYETKVKNMNIIVKLPENNIQNNIKVFLKGINGYTKVESNNSIKFEINNLDSDKYATGRIIFPKELIDKSVNISNENAYKRIINEENNYMKNQQRKEEMWKLGKKYSAYVSYFIIGANIILFILLGNKIKRKEDFLGTIYLPNESTPAVIQRLCNSSISGIGLFATILDLSRKGFIKIEKMEVKLNKYEFILMKLKDEDSNLIDHEKFLLNWIFQYGEDGEKVSMKKLTKIAQSIKTDYYKKLVEWKRLVAYEEKRLGYLDERYKGLGSRLIAISIVQIVISIMLLIFSNVAFGVITMIFSIVILIAGISLITRLSDKGEIERKKWIEFKKQFRNQESSDIADYPMDRYFPYAVALGVSIKNLKLFRDNIMNNDLFSDTWLYAYFILDTLDYDQSFVYYGYNSYASSAEGASSSSGGGAGASGGGAGGF